MALASSLLFLVALVPLAGVLILVRRLWRQRLLRKIPGPDNASLLTGNFPQFFNPGAMAYQDQLVDTYGRVFKINGYFGDQMLVTSDLQALYQVIVKHVDIFDTAEYFLELTRLGLGKGLLAAPMAGDIHKRQRRLMNPAFSTAHMKRMIPVFHAVSQQLRDIIAGDIKRTGHEETDIMDMMGRAALELIAQTGFGYTFGALNGSDTSYSYAIKRLAPNGARLFKYRPILPFLTRNFPPRLLRAIGKLIPMDALQQAFNLTDTITLSAAEIWEEKKRLHALGEKASNSEMGQGHDLLSLLLNENSKAAEQDRMPDDELLGQINTFLEVQDRLRQEFIAAGAPDNLDYELLDRLPYLDAVCRETLRLYAPVRFIQRVARQDHVLPLDKPIVDVDGKPVPDIFVPKGTTVYCNVAAVNTDSAIWGADAKKWNPERWLNPLLTSVIDAHIPGIYSNMLTSAGGARSCIGFKFSQLEMKVLLSQLLPPFRFQPSEKREIMWRFGGLVTPATKEGFMGSKPELPLRISLL